MSRRSSSSLSSSSSTTTTTSKVWWVLGGVVLLLLVVIVGDVYKQMSSRSSSSRSSSSSSRSSSSSSPPPSSSSLLSSVTDGVPLPRENAHALDQFPPAVYEWDTAYRPHYVPLARFELGEMLGHGFSSIGLRARDTRSGAMVAIKLIHKSPFHPREMALLDALRGVDGVPQLLAAVSFDADDSPSAAADHLRVDEHVASLPHDTRAMKKWRESRFHARATRWLYALVVEWCPHAESWWLESDADVGGARHLSPTRRKRYVRRMLRILRDVHARGIVHRDIKRYNWWVDPSGDADEHAEPRVWLGDWGSASFYVAGDEMSPRIATPEYKAPELLALSRYYSYEVDMWAFGILFGYMLFDQSASNWIPTLKCGQQFVRCWPNLVFLFGRAAVRRWADAHRLYFNATQVEHGFALSPGGGDDDDDDNDDGDDDANTAHIDTLGDDWPIEPAALDLLRSLLRLEAHERLTATEALAHPYFDELRDEHSEIGLHHHAEQRRGAHDAAADALSSSSGTTTGSHNVDDAYVHATTAAVDHEEL